MDPTFEACHHLAFFLLENGSFASIRQRYTVQDIIKSVAGAKAKEIAVSLQEWFEIRSFRKSFIHLFQDIVSFHRIHGKDDHGHQHTHHDLVVEPIDKAHRIHILKYTTGDVQMCTIRPSADSVSVIANRIRC